MNTLKEAILILTFGLFFMLASAAFAGGEPSSIDPLNGCFERVGYSGEEQEASTRDFITHRNLYRIMVDPDRFAVSKACWQGRSRCIKVATICRKGGAEVYSGFTWFWR